MNNHKHWLTLREAAALLGVHPSTVRNWADSGRIPVQRTAGGHRRFRMEDIELWLESEQTDAPESATLILQSAIGRTRLMVSAGELEKERWYQKLDEDARSQYRRSGRALVQGIISYLGSDGESAVAQARATGIEYATIGRRCGLSRLEATRAFLFFRNTLLESLVSVFENAAIHSPHTWGEMLRKMNGFADQVLLALLEQYQVYLE